MHNYSPHSAQYSVNWLLVWSKGAFMPQTDIHIGKQGQKLSAQTLYTSREPETQLLGRYRGIGNIGTDADRGGEGERAVTSALSTGKAPLAKSLTVRSTRLRVPVELSTERKCQSAWLLLLLAPLRMKKILKNGQTQRDVD